MPLKLFVRLLMLKVATIVTCLKPSSQAHESIGLCRCGLLALM